MAAGPTRPSLINKYKPHNNVSGGSILMTIVEPRPLYVTSTLDEGKRPDVSDGQKAKIALPAEGSDRVARRSEIDLADSRRLRQIRNQFRRRAG